MFTAEKDSTRLLLEEAGGCTQLDTAALSKKKEKPSGPINVSWFEVDELQEGVQIQFSESFRLRLGDDRTEFFNLHEKICHYGANDADIYDPSWKVRADEICVRRLNIQYDDIRIFRGALESYLEYEKKQGNLAVAAEELPIKCYLRKVKPARSSLLSYQDKVANLVASFKKSSN